MGSHQLDWPTGWDRTPSSERTRNNRFQKTLRESIDDLADELQRLGVDDWRLSTGAEHQKQNPKYPYADASPDDPGVVVRWTMRGGQYAVACDDSSKLRDNVRNLYLYLREKRKMEDRPVTTGEDEFANARLPPAESEAPADNPPHVILGVSPDAEPADVQDAYRRLTKTAHPDHGGSAEEFCRLTEAMEAMLP
jgi:hypothetical protein